MFTDTTTKTFNAERRIDRFICDRVLVTRGIGEVVWTRAPKEDRVHLATMTRGKDDAFITITMADGAILTAATRPTALLTIIAAAGL